MKLGMVHIATQLQEIEMELNSLLHDIQSERINQSEFESRLKPLIERQCSIVDSLHAKGAPSEKDGIEAAGHSLSLIAPSQHKAPLYKKAGRRTQEMLRG